MKQKYKLKNNNKKKIRSWNIFLLFLVELVRSPTYGHGVLLLFRRLLLGAARTITTFQISSYMHLFLLLLLQYKGRSLPLPPQDAVAFARRQKEQGAPKGRPKGRNRDATKPRREGETNASDFILIFPAYF